MKNDYAKIVYGVFRQIEKVKLDCFNEGIIYSNTKKNESLTKEVVIKSNVKED